MPWQSLGDFSLTDQWQTTPSVTGELFRIKHSSIPEGVPTPRAVIAQSFLDEQSVFNTFESQLLTYKQEVESFSFYFPNGLTEHSIAIKRLDNFQFPWNLTIETFVPENDTQAVELNKFYELIVLLNSVPIPVTTMGTNLTPSYNNVFVVRRKSSLLVPANANRKELIIRNPNSKDLILGFSVDDNNVLKEELWEVGKKETFRLPIAYRGDIYCKSSFTGVVYVCQFE